jgi:CUB/sushi domain-containing protein
LCDIVTCDFPGQFSNGKYIMGTHNDLTYVSGSLNYTTKIEVQCDTGYKMENSTIRICESNGTWSGDDPQCSIVQCRFKELNIIVNSHYILNGEIKFDADFANYNDTVSVVCIKGYRQDSNRNATCSADGTWSNQSSSCTIVTCLTPIETSYVKYQTWYNTSYGIFTNKLPYGASVNATCKQGALKGGSRIRYCQENGSWDGEIPVCGKCIVKISV